jgi:hypothetical protein
MAISPNDRATTANTLASLARELDRQMLKIQQFKTWLDTVTDAELLASPFSFVQGDINVMRSATGDMDQLRTLYQGGATLGSAKDFRTFTKLTYPFGSIL